MATDRPGSARGVQADGNDLTGLLRKLVKSCDNPARLIELYYWSQEPELIEVMRQFIALPEEAKNSLCAFFGMAKGHAASVSVTVSPQGELTLSSPVVSEVMETMVAAGPPEKGPEFLH